MADKKEKNEKTKQEALNSVQQDSSGEKEQGKETTRRDPLHEVMKHFVKITYIKPEDIPDIPLYMDQITSLMDAKLKSCKRHPDDKILTKTMINNYTKNKLIPPPVKKKYSKEHLILLIFVYYMKDFMSINDIAKLLKPLEDGHFQKEDGLSLSDVYERVTSYVKGQTDYMSRDLYHRWKVARQLFEDAEGADKEYLDVFSFICLLSFDVYVKKQLIEHLIDEFLDDPDAKSKK